MTVSVSTVVVASLIGSLDKVEFQLDWEDTMGYTLAQMYRNRVANREYQQFELV